MARKQEFAVSSLAKSKIEAFQAGEFGDRPSVKIQIAPGSDIHAMHAQQALQLGATLITAAQHAASGREGKFHPGDCNPAFVTGLLAAGFDVLKRVGSIASADAASDAQ